MKEISDNQIPEKPKVSIIIPIYNVEKYLKECLDSIINQTLKNLEFICINDGSTDNSLNILNSFAEKDSRFVIITQENQGQGIARNKGIELAKGEFIAFVDPDDKLELIAMEKLYNFAKQKNANVVQFNYTKFNEYNKKKPVVFHKKYHKEFGYDIRKKGKFNWKNLKCDKLLVKLRYFSWVRFYSTNFLRENNIRFAPTKHGEDVLFIMGVIFNAPEIYYLDKNLYWYRKNKTSITNKKSKTGFDLFKNIKLEEEFLRRKNILPEYDILFKNYKISRFVLHYKQIADEYIPEYIQLVKEHLSSDEYKDFISKINKPKYSLKEKIFSVKNEYINGEKYKNIMIAGIKISSLKKSPSTN